MSLLSLIMGAVFTAGNVVSPLPAAYAETPAAYKPSVSFAQLATTGGSAASDESVLGEETAPAETPTETPSPTPTPLLTRKSAYTIALLGDSMIDTLGPDAPHLKKRLASLYPGRSFTILNYGVGGTNIDYGLERITSGYSYLGNSIPSLASRHPDIVVVESFGYNPYAFETGAIDRHWLQLAAVVDQLRRSIPKVRIVIAATIAPNSQTFGNGAPGLSFSPDEKRSRTAVIKQYLDSTVKFSQSQHLPLADAFHSSMNSSGDGILTYINHGDNIHYSDAGRALFAQKVADAIVSNKLLE